MASSEDTIEMHIHNPLIEGPLPEGFRGLGREGKVRNIYEAAGEICLIASDRVSAFDQVSPTPIPGKGEILNGIAAQELQAAEEAGIPTWFKYVPDNNPRAAVGIRGVIQPVEMIFRNFMTGSMWREYRDTGDFAGYGLPSGWQEWQDFTAAPLFTPSTKEDKDVNLNPEDLLDYTGIDHGTFYEMKAICRELFRLGTARAAERGLILIDTKYEVILTPDGQLRIADEVHTPDSSRFALADGFSDDVANGRKVNSLSKEYLRQIILERAGGDVDAAKELMKQPLPDEVVEETVARYRQLQALFTDS